MLCKNKISDMEIHITLSVNKIPNIQQKDCYIIPYYITDRGGTITGGQVTISTWQKHLVNSSVVSSRATDFPMKTLDLTPSRAFTALPTPGLGLFAYIVVGIFAALSLLVVVVFCVLLLPLLLLLFLLLLLLLLLFLLLLVLFFLLFLLLLLFSSLLVLLLFFPLDHALIFS